MSNFMTFEGPTFTMQVPTNWFITSSSRFQAIFVSPEQDEGERIRPNLLISIRKLKEGITASMIAESAREKQQEDYPNYEVIAEKAHNTEDISVFERVYRWHNPEQESDVQQWQTFYVKQNVLYTLTATCSITEKLPVHEKIFEQMLTSFKFIPD